MVGPSPSTGTATTLGRVFVEPWLESRRYSPSFALISSEVVRDLAIWSKLTCHSCIGEPAWVMSCFTASAVAALVSGSATMSACSASASLAISAAPGESPSVFQLSTVRSAGGLGLESGRSRSPRRQHGRGHSGERKQKQRDRWPQNAARVSRRGR